jgi:hypothetical protein
MAYGTILPGASKKYICLPLEPRQEPISQNASRQDTIPASKLLVWVTGKRVEAQAYPSFPFQLALQPTTCRIASYLPNEAFIPTPVRPGDTNT